MGKSKRKESNKSKTCKVYHKTSRSDINQQLKEIGKFEDLEEFEIEDEEIIMSSYD